MQIFIWSWIVDCRCVCAVASWLEFVVWVFVRQTTPWTRTHYIHRIRITHGSTYLTFFPLFACICFIRCTYSFHIDLLILLKFQWNFVLSSFRIESERRIHTHTSMRERTDGHKYKDEILNYVVRQLSIVYIDKALMRMGILARVDRFPLYTLLMYSVCRVCRVCRVCVWDKHIICRSCVLYSNFLIQIVSRMHAENVTTGKQIE